MITNQITQKIVGYAVKTATDAPAADTVVEHIHEAFPRPEMMLGATYKIKSHLMEHAIYVTVNDILLNEGTELEQRHPYEIFINSKNMEHYQWVVALTRLISAVFRKGGEIQFLVEELKSVFDPKGGYMIKGGGYMPSLVAEIGYVIEKHLRWTGVIKTEGMSEAQNAFLEEKRQQFEAQHGVVETDDGYPEKATVCSKCNQRAVVRMDNCDTCLACSDSKCG